MKLVKKTMTISTNGKTYEIQIEVPTYVSADDIATNMDEKEFVDLLNYAVELGVRGRARSKFVYDFESADRAEERLKKAQERVERLKKFKVREVK